MKKEHKISKRIIVIVISSLCIILVVILFLHFKDRKDVNDIEKIEVTTGGYLLSTANYTIDFISDEIHYLIEDKGMVKTDSARLDENDKEFFVSKANLYGMFHWKESYKPDEDIYDGKYTEIYITYTDGSSQEILCSNDYPATYEKMQEVFYEAFGYNVL